eukprot:g80803.t1
MPGSAGWVVLCACLWHLCLVRGSVGDREPVFVSCTRLCEERRCLDPELSVLPWWLEITFWTCPENCRYECMHNITRQRAAEGLGSHKYYGKWPFLRLLGLQELFSTLFSIANAVPHLLMFRRLGQSDLAGHVMSPLLRLWNLGAFNTWLWSTVFHARDFFLTERLDYYFSAHYVYACALVAVVYTLELRSPTLRTLIGILVNTAWLGHVGYLHFVHMDYGLHVKISLCLGLVYLLMWLVYAWRRWRPHTWLLLLSLASLLTAALLEVGDFPPLWGLLDAHAIWHGCTPFSAYITYRFFVLDLLAHPQHKRDL